MSLISLDMIEGCKARTSYMREEGVGAVLKDGSSGE